LTHINSRNKPDIVEKIVLSKEEMDQVNDILEGKPGVNVIKYWKKKGMDVSQKTKWYTPTQIKERKRILSAQYNIRMCSICNNFPSVRLIWKTDGVQILQYYCNDCYNKIK
jgi:hypothetical protein